MKVTVKLTFGGILTMYRIGDIIEVKIIGIRAYGLFVTDQKDRKGLIHVSECDDGFIKNLQVKFAVGQKVKAIVMEDDGDKKFSLSIRALKETKGNLKDYPRPVTFYVGRKRYWTKSHYISGFEPLSREAKVSRKEKEKEFHENA